MNLLKKIVLVCAVAVAACSAMGEGLNFQVDGGALDRDAFKYVLIKAKSNDLQLWSGAITFTSEGLLNIVTDGGDMDRLSKRINALGSGNKQDQPNLNFYIELLGEKGGDPLAVSDLMTIGTLAEKLKAGTPIAMPFTVPTPEPTSGLLFLVGGALLGLRRKRRAA